MSKTNNPENRATNHLKRKVTPRRPKNADVRTREYLTEKEIEKLIEGCEGNRRPHRDATMILIAFRHGLRASEVCDLQWTQVDFAAATLAVTRAKHGTSATHPLTGRELRALRRLHREVEGRSPFVFVSERGSPMTVSNLQKLLNRAGEAAGLKIKVHPHMSPGERRPRHARPASLPGPQKHTAHGALHRAGTDPLPGLVERLKGGEDVAEKHSDGFTRFHKLPLQMATR